jgi:hypothetical protein
MRVRGDPFVQAALTGSRLRGEFIVDAHAHMGRWSAFPVPRGDADGMVEVMDRVGVRVVCPAAHASVGPDFRLGNDLVIAAQRRYPRRIVGYIGVNPCYGDEGCFDEVRRCENKGLRNVKIHSLHGRPYDDPPYRRVYEYANSKGWAVLAHTWGDATCSTLAAMAKEFPCVNFLLAHTGVNGYGEYLKAVAAAPNIYLELALSNTPYGIVAELVRQVGADRIVFGSDIPFLSLCHQIGKVLCAEISVEDKRKILGLNARRILRL